MAKSFDSLLARAKTSWSEDDHAIFEAASTAFVSEAAVQAEIGASLAAARNDLNLTQQRLSEMTGVQQSEISRIERGIANPTTLTLARLAGATGRRLTLS